MTSEQILGARAFLRWRQLDLADKSGVSLATIKRIESKVGELSCTKPVRDAIVRSFVVCGITFCDGGVQSKICR